MPVALRERAIRMNFCAPYQSVGDISSFSSSNAFAVTVAQFNQPLQAGLVSLPPWAGSVDQFHPGRAIW